MSAVIACDDLAVGRSGRRVLRSLSLRIAPGERWALLGRNGSGKSTLLRALAGLDAPLSGTLRWLGAALPRGRERASVLGVLLQHEPSSRFTVRELVTLGLALDGPADASARATVSAVLERLDLVALAERSCDSLSGGEAQRAALARALVAQPAALLLDEPSNHLDPANAAALLSVLDRVQPRPAVVLATHDLELAARCDRVALLHDGVIIATGAPHAVLDTALLAQALGIRVRRVEDPEGGAPFLRVLGPVASEVCA